MMQKQKKMIIYVHEEELWRINLAAKRVKGNVFTTKEKKEIEGTIYGKPRKISFFPVDILIQTKDVLFIFGSHKHGLDEKLVIHKFLDAVFFPNLEYDEKNMKMKVSNQGLTLTDPDKIRLMRDKRSEDFYDFLKKIEFSYRKTLPNPYVQDLLGFQIKMIKNLDLIRPNETEEKLQIENPNFKLAKKGLVSIDFRVKDGFYGIGPS